MRSLRRLGFAWLIWRVFGPEPIPAFPPGQVHPMRIPGRSVFVGDREFFVREVGDVDAPVLVLVHGWGDHTQIIWHRLIPVLRDRLRVVAIDLRSHGRSAAGRGSFDVRDLADDVAGVMDALGLGSVAVFGYSLGGMIAQELVHRHPAKVSRLILGGTWAGGQAPARRMLLSVVWTLGRAFDRISRVEASAIKHAYLVRSGVVGPEHSRWLWDELMDRDPDLYWQAGFAALRFDARDLVGRLVVPALVVIPTEDQLVPVAAQYDLVGRLADPELLEVSGARHELPITHAAQLGAAIERFVEKEGQT
jgi:pimeloyl-ACP methyl ester carboxylesterase